MTHPTDDSVDQDAIAERLESMRIVATENESSADFIINRIESCDWNEMLKDFSMQDGETLAPRPNNTQEQDESQQRSFACIATSLPTQLFASEQIRTAFEALFIFDHSRAPTFLYFRSFRRCRIAFTSMSDLKEACSKHREFYLTFADPETGSEMRFQCHCYAAASNSYPNLTSNSGSRFLEPPLPVKQFLISPPSSPPAGWQQQLEPIPNRNQQQQQIPTQPDNSFDHDELFTALLRVQQEQQDSYLPSHCQNVLKSESEEMPSIVLHRCEDQQKFYHADQ